MPSITVKGLVIDLSDITDIEWSAAHPEYGFEYTVTLDSDDKYSWLEGGSDEFILTTAAQGVHDLSKSDLNSETLELLTQVVMTD